MLYALYCSPPDSLIPSRRNAIATYSEAFATIMASKPLDAPGKSVKFIDMPRSPNRRARVRSRSGTEVHKRREVSSSRQSFRLNKRAFVFLYLRGVVAAEWGQKWIRTLAYLWLIEMRPSGAAQRESHRVEGVAGEDGISAEMELASLDLSATRFSFQVANPAKKRPTRVRANSQIQSTGLL